MSEQILREKIREIIKRHISENKDKELTREGIIDGVFGHIKKVLKKGADKRLHGKLAKIAKAAPAGKAAVEKFYKSQEEFAKAAEKVDDVLDDLGFEY